MAAAKQFELLFQLTARLGPNFSQSFKNASQTMKLLQNDLRSADQKLKNVSAYQKQQNAVKKSQQRVSELEAEHERLTKEIEETGRATPELTRQLQANEKALQKARDTTAQEEERLGELSNTLREAGVNTDNLGRDTDELRQRYERLERTQRKVQEITQKQAANKQAISQTKAQLRGLVGTVAAVGAAIYAGPVKKAAEFQEQMSTVKAITGSVGKEELPMLIQKANEMGLAFKEGKDSTETAMNILAEKASAMGASTKFTSTEAAEALEYMAMAGWKAEDMLDGIEGVMNLAAATGEELGSTSDIVTDALTAFGLKAKDTNAFVDDLAQAARSSNTDVSEMGNAFGQVATAAGALKYSTKDVAVVLGAMANNSIKGEKAGTQLAKIFTRMSGTNSSATKAMKELNLEMFNSDGSARKLSNVMNDLRDRFSNLTQKEKENYAYQIAGQSGMNGLLAVVNSSADDWKKLTREIEGSTGAAAEMAAIKLDNLNGDITLMKSAWDALNISLGETLMPTLRGVVQRITEVINTANDFVKNNPEAVKTIAKVAAALVGLKAGGLVAKLGFLEVQGGIWSIQKAFELIKGDGMNNFISGITGGFLNFKNIGGGILNYFKGIKVAAGGVTSAFGSMLNGSAIFTRISGFFGGMAGKMSGILTTAGSQMLAFLIKPFSAIGGRLGGILSGLGGIIVNSPLGKIGSFIGKGLGKITSFIAPVGNAIKTMLGPLGKLATSIFGPLGGVVGKILPIVGVITTIITVVQLVKNHLQEIRGFIQKTFGDGALAVFDKVIAVITNIGNTIKNIFSDGNIGAARNKIQEIFGDNGIKVFDTLVNILGTVRSAVSNVIQFIIDNVVPVAEKVLQVIITSVIPGIVSFIQAAAPTIMSIIQSVVEFVGAVIPVIADFIAGLMPVISEIIAFLQEYVLPIISEIFSFVISVVLPAISVAVQEILPVVVRVLQTLLPAIQTALKTIWKIVAPIIEGILSAVKEAMPVILSVVKSVIETISGVISNLVTVLGGIIDFVTGVFTGDWSKAWNGVKDIFSGVWESLKTIAKGAIDSISKFVNGITDKISSLKEKKPGAKSATSGGGGASIPGFANGTVRTPDTFIAGENGPELITGAANRSVFTAAQTGQIFNNMAKAQDLNTASNVNAVAIGASTITIHVANNPTVNVNGGETDGIKEQLQQYDEEFLEKIRQIIITILKEQKEQEGRVAYA